MERNLPTEQLSMCQTRDFPSDCGNRQLLWTSAEHSASSWLRRAALENTEPEVLRQDQEVGEADLAVAVQVSTSPAARAKETVVN